MTAIGIGAITASLAGATLLWRGTPLDRMWVLNVRAYNQLTRLGRAIGIPFLLLGWLYSRPEWAGSNIGGGDGISRSRSSRSK